MITNSQSHSVIGNASVKRTVRSPKSKIMVKASKRYRRRLNKSKSQSKFSKLYNKGYSSYRESTDVGSRSKLTTSYQLLENKQIGTNKTHSRNISTAVSISGFDFIFRGKVWAKTSISQVWSKSTSLEKQDSILPQGSTLPARSWLIAQMKISLQLIMSEIFPIKVQKSSFSFFFFVCWILMNRM